MGAYKYLQVLYRKKQSDALRFLLRLRTWEFRQLPKIVRANQPTRPDKARRIGYRAKQGYVIYRARIRRGGRRKQVRKGNTNGKPAGQGIHMKPNRNLQVMAEARVGRRCGNLRVISSYWVSQDARYKWYEVVCVDPFHQAIRNDPKIRWATFAKQKHRECRGKTTAGRRARGLMNKGNGAMKLRPSKRATWKAHNTYNFARKR
ncbi:ribosomal protein L15 [Acrasis kona]|uniref:Ribosomal protein L15 n=1 Tax=Acrasis kona TaxID=1008807 RepID=A0AAW2ZB13_9EUKA